jgi:hypothetical protein
VAEDSAKNKKKLTKIRIWATYGRFFRKKIAPNAKKYRPNGEISPNLVALIGVDVFIDFFVFCLTLA